VTAQGLLRLRYGDKRRLRLVISAEDEGQLQQKADALKAVAAEIARVGSPRGKEILSSLECASIQKIELTRQELSQVPSNATAVWRSVEERLTQLESEVRSLRELLEEMSS